MIATVTMNLIPRIPIGKWVSDGIDWLTDNARGLFDAISTFFGTVIDALSELLLLAPSWLMVVIFALIALTFRSIRFTIGTVIGFVLLEGLNQWDKSMQTLALVIFATLCATLMAVPLGIWAAASKRVSAAVKPVLDFMQTMPAFVYLIPAVTFFSIGAVPGLISTIIFAIPPGVRMTELGIRQVNAETVEAGQSFGASKRQILTGIQLPLAVPSIMAGINQVIMLALSMAVIAGMVGADGLGKEVVNSISTLNTAKGVEAGLSVVILAIYLDRLTAALGAPREHRNSIYWRIHSRRKQAAAEKRRLAEAATETTDVVSHDEAQASAANPEGGVAAQPVSAT